MKLLKKVGVILNILLGIIDWGIVLFVIAGSITGIITVTFLKAVALVLVLSLVLYVWDKVFKDVVEKTTSKEVNPYAIDNNHIAFLSKNQDYEELREYLRFKVDTYHAKMGTFKEEKGIGVPSLDLVKNDAQKEKTADKVVEKPSEVKARTLVATPAATPKARNLADGMPIGEGIPPEEVSARQEEVNDLENMPERKE